MGKWEYTERDERKTEHGGVLDILSSEALAFKILGLTWNKSPSQPVVTNRPESRSQVARDAFTASMILPFCSV